jgi:hypothetical protein
LREVKEGPAPSSRPLPTGDSLTNPVAAPLFSPLAGSGDGYRSGSQASGTVVDDSLREKLIKIGAKVASHEGHVGFKMAEAAASRLVLADILPLIARLRASPCRH